MHIPYKYDSNLLIAGVHTHQKEIILGMCAALIVFLFILTVFCASRSYDEHAKLGTSAGSDEVFLHEVCVHGNSDSRNNAAVLKH